MKVPPGQFDHIGSGLPRSGFLRARHLDAIHASANGRAAEAIEASDDILYARRPFYYLAIALVLVSLLLRQPLLFIAGLLLAAVTFLPEVWYRFGLRQVSMVREPATRRAAFGDVVEVRLLVENRKPLPLPALEIVDEIPDALPVIGMPPGSANRPERTQLIHQVSLWAYQRVRRRFHVHAINRGAFELGPTLLRSGDPFGMLTREQTRKAHTTLLVHPLVAPIERFNLPAVAPFGEQKARRKLLEDPLRVAGTRAYMPGDEPRRIHWKATARTGSLQSKVYEPATRHSLAVFLNVRTFLRQTMGYDPALVELGICASASIATWALGHGYATGLYSNGTLQLTDDGPDTASPRMEEPGGMDAAQDLDARIALATQRLSVALRLHIAPAAHPGQETRILDGLARLLPFYGLPMDQVIASEQSRLPPGTIVVYIGTDASVDVPLLIALRHLHARGHEVSLLLLRTAHSDEVPQDGPLPLAGFPVHYLGDRELWRTLVVDALGTQDIEQTTWHETFRVEQHENAAHAAGRGTSPVPEGAEDFAHGENGAGDAAASGEAAEHRGPRTPRPLVVE